MGLARERCVACRRDSPRVTDDDIVELHPTVAEWGLTEDDGVNRLDRTFEVKGFADAMALADMVGSAAEEEGHHPDIHLAWGSVGVEIWTHKINGLTESDFILAAKIDRLDRGPGG